MEEQSAIRQLKKGDPSGLEFLVRTYQVKAIRAAYLITRDEELARDIVQAAFLRAYERIDQFHARKSFGPWFLRSVVNDALKAASRGKKQVSFDTEARDNPSTELLPDISPDPEELISSAELQDAIRVSLDRLDPHQRASIVLRYYFEWTDAEIAEAFGRPRGTVRRWLHDARQHLSKLLQPWHPFGASLRE